MFIYKKNVSKLVFIVTTASLIMFLFISTQLLWLIKLSCRQDNENKLFSENFFFVDKCMCVWLLTNNNNNKKN